MNPVGRRSRGALIQRDFRTQIRASSRLLLRFTKLLTAAVGLACIPLSSHSLATGAEPGSDLFAQTAVWQVWLEVTPQDFDSLRRDSRAYVRATVREGTNEWRDTGIHLKGATGSFRPLDDKPAFTLSFDEFRPGQRFHGLSKVHLNNSVEDASYLDERLGAELFRGAGIPAPRVSHAEVHLNGRRLGLYVLKEGFAPEFLARHFARTDGNLYDAGTGSEITGPLKRGSGGGPADGSDLQRLADSARAPDLALRWRRLGEVLDLDRFLSFMAMEVLSGHRDGYCLARNNYRLYHDPASDRFVFLPAGMDQLLGRVDLPLHPHFAGLLAQAVMETPEGRRAYRDRVGTLFTNVFQVATLTNQLRGWASNVARALPKAEARALQREAEGVCEGVERRAANVARQLALPEPAPLRFENGIAKPGGWRAVDAPAGGGLDSMPAPDGRPALHIRAGPTTSASWRTKVWLTAGRYHFEGLARTRGVKPLPFGRNHGAALDATGGRPSRWLTGDTAWTKIEIELDIREPNRELDLICALRAGAGEAWFDAASLRLTRLPGTPR